MNQEYGFSPSGHGVEIRVPETDYVAAELVEDCHLYVLFYIYQSGIHGKFETLKKLMELASLELGSPEERAERARLRREQELERARQEREQSADHLRRLIARQKDDQIRQLDSKKRVGQQSLEEASGEVVRLTRKLTSLLPQRAALEVQLRESRHYAETNFRALMETPEVDEVLVEGNLIYVYTTDLVVSGEASRHILGKFALVISVAEGSLKCFNMSRQADDGSHAPNVLPDGILVADGAEEIPVLVGSRDIAAAVQKAVSLIQSFEGEIDSELWTTAA